MARPIERFVEEVLARGDVLAALLEAPDVESFRALALRTSVELGVPLQKDELDRALVDARRTHIERWLR